MLEGIAKNLWLLLTVVIPGLFTYGAWRTILLLEPSKRLTSDALKQLDSSALVTTSIIIAIALLQQAVAIMLEAGLALLAKTMRTKWPSFYTLFCERFALAAAGKLDENATRIIGNFFLSTNMCIGLGLLLLYFLSYESLALTQWVPIALLVLLVATLAAAVFRMFNAEWVVEECKKRRPNKKSQHTKHRP
jgi:hypothetical protein